VVSSRLGDLETNSPTAGYSVSIAATSIVRTPWCALITEQAPAPGKKQSRLNAEMPKRELDIKERAGQEAGERPGVFVCHPEA